MVAIPLVVGGGCGATALSRWLNGKYTGDNAALEAKVCQWLEDQACQTAFLPSKGADWIETPTARQIGMAIAYAHLSRDIAVVCGGAGVGKTITAQHYAQTRPNCWVCTMVPSFANAPACLKALLFALAPSQRADGRGGDVVYRMLLTYLSKKDALLIIDEAQHLTRPALECLRALHDATACALVFMGNESVYTRMSGPRSAEYAQLFSRVGKVLNPKKARRADVEAIAQAWGVSEQKALGFLIKIGHGHGALREVTKTLRLASLAANGARQALSLSHLKTAYSERGGVSE